MIRVIKIVSILILVLQCSAVTGQTNSLTIPYGNGSRIIYHLDNGNYDVYAGNLKIITNAFGLVKNNDQAYSTEDYKNNGSSQMLLQDKFGKGKKYTIILTKSESPALEQIFYVYPGHDYFFTEIQMKGSDLKSNYLAPLVADKIKIYAKGDNRTLFTPFDNDAFVRYDAKSMKFDVGNTSSELAAIYENTSRKGLITGSVQHTVWKTGIQSKGKSDECALSVWSGYAEEGVTRDKAAHGSVTGSAIKSAKIFVGYFNDWRIGMEAFGKANRLEEPPFIFNWKKAVPFGWNSWGVIQEKLTYEKAIKVVDFFAHEIPEFRNDSTAYIDLDSFWDNITGGMKGDYSKLKAFADYCKSKGLQPGVYWTPFTDWGFKSGGDREAEGSKYKFSEMWTKVGNAYHDFDGARALDPTHPGTKRRIDYIIDKLKDCGFKMIKIDFLGHAAVEGTFYDQSVTTGMQAYRAGMEYLVNRLDGQMLVYAAISPSLASGRYVHVRRIACDAWKTIKDTEYTLNSVTYGWWQTYLYNYIDADHVVFASETEGSNKARFVSSLITGSLINGDDFSANGPWQDVAKKFFQNQQLLNIARNGLSFMPLDGNTGKKASEIFLRKIGTEVYVAILNYDSKAKQYHIPLKKLNLHRTMYKAIELFDHKSLTLNKEISLMVHAADAGIIKINVE